VNVAAHAELGIAQRRPTQWPVLIAGACALVLVAATAEIVLDGALAHSPLIPKSPAIAGWMTGIGERLGYRTFLIALLASAGAYGALLALARTLSARSAIVLVGVLHAIVFAGPILISTDVFSYIAYARMGVEHGLNPYTHGPIAIVHDPVYYYVGVDWKHVATAYGPLYTLLSYPLAPLGLRGALWAMKLEALLASAGTLALTWRCARERGKDPVFALLALGANPLYVIYTLGGAHNDLIMILLMMAAVSLTLAADRGSASDAPAAAAVVAGALVKATVAALLPFMLLADRSIGRRVSVVAGALAALALGALVAFLAFGAHGVDVVAALNRDAAFVSTDSFPTEIAHLFGKPGVFPVDHDLLKGALVVIVLHLLWRTWRGYDWVAASGWTLLAISVTSTWLLAWYIVWPLPLALVARDRRLLVATLVVQALFIVHQTTPLFAPVS
jgi:alpha-1,6-mannosyltransferase